MSWDIEMQRAAEKHIEACVIALEAEESGEPAAESPAYGPFCGCTTCVVREVLTVSWGYLRRHAPCVVPIEVATAVASTGYEGPS